MRDLLHVCVDPPIPVVVFFFLVGLVVLWKRTSKAQFLALIVSSVLAFSLGEGVCRLLGFGTFAMADWQEPYAREKEYPYEPLGRLVYRYATNPRGYFNDNNEVTGNINGGGFRGPEIAMDKPEGVCRVAFLGDSFTLGVGVRDEDTMPRNFERAVRKTRSNVEVLNFGVSGTSTDQQIRLLREFGLSFQPDVVIVVMFLNDANRIKTMKFLSRPVVLANVRKYSYFINAIFQTVERPVLEKVMVRHYRDGYQDDNEGWKSIMIALDEGIRLSKEHGFRLVVALYPVLIDLDETRYPYTEIHEQVGRTCESMGISFVDLFEGLRGQTDHEMWVHATDQHPNEVAQAISAGQLADSLLDQQWFCDRGQEPVDSPSETQVIR